VPAGEFPYQNGDPCFVESFYIGKYEVTNDEYCNFLNAADSYGEHYDPNMQILQHGTTGEYTYTVKNGNDPYPLNYVSWFDAEAYAQWRSSSTGLNFRLPTEYEWEKAAGWDPVQQYHYTYGYHQDIHGCEWMNYNNLCYGGLLPVGSFNGTEDKENAKCFYGCYDMSGNVWEWTSSMYSDTKRVLRGGCWHNNASSCTVTRRYNGFNPSDRYYSVGFRLVLDLD